MPTIARPAPSSSSTASNETVAAGMIDFGLRRATNIHSQSSPSVRRSVRELKHQKPAILWFTGLSGAGKSTIANLVEDRAQRPRRSHHHAGRRQCPPRSQPDLGFTEADRVENIRRVGEVAKLMTEAGLSCFARLFRLSAPNGTWCGNCRYSEFIEIFVDTPLEVCIARDPKGLYAARRPEKSRISPALISPTRFRKIRVASLGRERNSRNASRSGHQGVAKKRNFLGVRIQFFWLTLNFVFSLMIAQIVVSVFGEAANHRPLQHCFLGSLCKSGLKYCA